MVQGPCSATRLPRCRWEAIALGHRWQSRASHTGIVMRIVGTFRLIEACADVPRDGSGVGPASDIVTAGSIPNCPCTLEHVSGRFG